MNLGKRRVRMSQKGEDQTAEDIGGRRTPGSGNMEFSKGDVKSDELLVERKDTERGSYSLKVAELEKLRKQAAKADRIPVFQVAFDGKSYAVIDWDWFLQLQRDASKP